LFCVLLAGFSLLPVGSDDDLPPEAGEGARSPLNTRSEKGAWLLAVP
jgi:hypothetical protein